MSRPAARRARRLAAYHRRAPVLACRTCSAEFCSVAFVTGPLEQPRYCSDDCRRRRRGRRRCTPAGSTRTEVSCPHCAGAGASARGSVTRSCWRCKGTGRLEARAAQRLLRAAG